MGEENNAWVFDSLIGFLHGPIWNAPLQTFIEEKSLVFDPNDLPDANYADHRRIHEEYKHLVDFMLGSFMEEMQITPEQFEVACLAGKHGTSGISFHHGLFQQIWAANDIKIFIRMMTQRNIELQLQALEMIERKRQVSRGSVSVEEPNEEEAPAEAVEAVEEEEEEKEKEVKEEEEATATEEQETVETNDAAEEGGNVEGEGLDEVIHEDVMKAIAEEIQPTVDPTITEEQEADKVQRLNLYFENENRKIDPDDVKSRQEYLRAQRDKIVALKRKVRTEQLNRNADATNRPKSSRAAHRVLFSTPEISNDTRQASLQVRKALAERLRTEVVDSNE